MCFTGQLSKIGFALPFVSNSFSIISCRFLPVKNFFQLFWSCFCFSLAATLVAYHAYRLVVKNFFLATLRFSPNGEGGIWTLAPLLTTYSLSRGAPSATWVLLQMPDSFRDDIFLKRRGWDSNPRALSDKRFSRPPRYDHFDTSPSIYSSAASVSPQRQDVFYHSFSLSSTPFSNFFYFFVFFLFSCIFHL